MNRRRSSRQHRCPYRRSSCTGPGRASPRSGPEQPRAANLRSQPTRKELPCRRPLSKLSRDPVWRRSPRHARQPLEQVGDLRHLSGPQPGPRLLNAAWLSRSFPGAAAGAQSAKRGWRTKELRVRPFSEPTRGFEPRTPSLRESTEGGSQSPPVPSGPAGKPKPGTPNDSEEPTRA